MTIKKRALRRIKNNSKKIKKQQLEKNKKKKMVSR